MFSIPPSDWSEAQKIAKSSPVPEPIQPNKEDVSTYHDTGVKFSGEARKRTGSTEYTRIRQETRFYSYRFPSGLIFGGNYTMATRSNSETKIFYANGLLINYVSNTNDIVLTFYDGNTNNPRYRFVLPSGSNDIYIDFKEFPREFSSSTIILNLSAGFTGHAHFLFQGWDEEK